MSRTLTLHEQWADPLGILRDTREIVGALQLERTEENGEPCEVLADLLERIDAAIANTPDTVP
jgi:hypothetical protein